MFAGDSDKIGGAEPSAGAGSLIRPPHLILFLYAASVLLILPVAGLSWPEMPGITPIFAGCLLLAEFSTAFLLFARFLAFSEFPVLLLACAYLYAGIVVVAHVLTFPSAIVLDRALVEVSPQATAWLFLSWLLGYGVLCLTAVLSRAQLVFVISPENNTRVVMIAVILTAISALCVVAFYVAFSELLPPLLDEGRWTTANKLLSAGALFVIACALASILLFVDRRDDLFRWLSVALVALLAANILSDAGGARYSVGWTLGRLSWLISSLVLFVYFLHDFVRHQAILSTAREELQSQIGSQAKQLHETATRFEEFMRHMPGLAWIKDPEGRYAYVNDAAEQAFDRSRDQLYGATDREIFPLETALQFEENDREARRTGRGVRTVEILRHRDGEIHHSVVSKFPIPSPDGKVFVGGVAIDITDHKHAEEALHESETRYRQLVEGLSDAVVWEGDPDTLRFTFVSEGAVNLLGYPTERWLDDPEFWANCLHPDDRARAIEYCREKTSAGLGHVLEYRMRAADGTYVWVRDRVYISEKGAKRISRGLILDVTKWKLANQLLRDNEERFRSMTEGAPVMIWISDNEGNCVHVNRLLREFWNVRNEDLGTFDWSEMLHPDDATRVKHEVIAALRSQSGFSIQARWRRANDGYRILKTDAEPRYSADGRFLGMIGVNVDVTETIIAGEELRQSEKRLKAATTAARLGIFEWDVFADHAVLENDRMYEILGHSAGDGTLSKAAFTESYIHPDDKDNFELALTEAIHRRSSFHAICRIRRKSDGEWRWIECFGNFDPAIRLKLIGVVADITERKQAEDELLRNTALLRAVSEGTTDMMYVKDRDCRIIYANPATSRVTGLPVTELLGTTGKEWGTPIDEVKAFLENDRNVIESGETQTVEEIFTGLDGPRTFLSTKVPMRDPEGRITGLIGVSRDITERKRTEQHTTMLLREVSHRAKNMLAVAQAIIRQSARNEAPESFAMIVSARLRALGATHDLLVESEWTSVVIRDLIRFQLAHLQHLIGSQIVLDGPPIRVRPAAAQSIGMAIHELSTNAQKYGALSTDAGRVHLKWETTHDDRGNRFTMSWIETGSFVAETPTRRGFGYDVIVRMVEHALDGEVSVEYLSSGLAWRLDAPVNCLDEFFLDLVPGR